MAPTSDFSFSSSEDFAECGGMPVALDKVPLLPVWWKIVTLPFWLNRGRFILKGFSNRLDKPLNGPH